MEKTNYEVLKTSNYQTFTFMKGNRNVNQMNLRRIVESMKTRCLFSPILVNDNMEIVDGQHRFLAQRELKLPIYYINVGGYSVEEVRILNSNATNWKKLDYLDGYVQMGLTPYVQFKSLMTDFPDFGIKALLSIVSVNTHSHSMKWFESGTMVIKDFAYSKIVAQKLMDFKEHFDKFHNPSFCIAIMQCLKVKGYDHDKMISRLKRRPNQIVAQTNAKNYITLLEDIYNYNSRNKLSLKY